MVTSASWGCEPPAADNTRHQLSLPAQPQGLMCDAWIHEDATNVAAGELPGAPDPPGSSARPRRHVARRTTRTASPVTRRATRSWTVSDARSATGHALTPNRASSPARPASHEPAVPIPPAAPPAVNSAGGEPVPRAGPVLPPVPTTRVSTPRTTGPRRRDPRSRTARGSISRRSSPNQPSARRNSRRLRGHPANVGSRRAARGRGRNGPRSPDAGSVACVPCSGCWPSSWCSPS